MDKMNCRAAAREGGLDHVELSRLLEKRNAMRPF